MCTLQVRVILLPQLFFVAVGRLQESFTPLCAMRRTMREVDPHLPVTDGVSFLAVCSFCWGTTAKQRQNVENFNSTQPAGRVEPASDEMSKIIYLRKDVHSFVPLEASPRVSAEAASFEFLSDGQVAASSSPPYGSTQLNNDSSNYLAPVCVVSDDKVRDEIRLNGSLAPTMTL